MPVPASWEVEKLLPVFLLTEGGDRIITEGGDNIVLETRKTFVAYEGEVRASGSWSREAAKSNSWSSE